ncbi:MAG: M24 family metallopeptidase [bacterium]
MALPFELAEYEARIGRARAAMRDARLDLLLLFHQESLYYLFGYDQIGYWVYQTVVLAADGSAPAAICRHADELMIRESSFIKEIRPWSDDSAVDPGTLTVDLLRERYRLSERRRIGVEKKTHALLPYYYDLLRAAMPDGVELVDASDLVSELRLIKSPAELTYMRRAAEIMDQAFTAGFAAARPGARECDVNAAVLYTLSTLGADYPAVAPPIASGPRTITQTHGAATERVMQAGDPLTIEIGAPYRRYHTVAVHSGCLGEPSAELRRLYDGLRDGIEAGLEMIRSGQPVAQLAATIVNRLESQGLSRKGRHVGYGTGIGYPPTWLDNLRIKETDPHVLAPGMTFFLFAGALTKGRDQCLYLGEPIAVSRDGCVRLSRLPLELRVL